MVPSSELGPVKLAFHQPLLLDSLYFKPEINLVLSLSDDDVEFR